MYRNIYMNTTIKESLRSLQIAMQLYVDKHGNSLVLSTYIEFCKDTIASFEVPYITITEDDIIYIQIKLIEIKNDFKTIQGESNK
jgi:hypothetical protein